MILVTAPLPECVRHKVYDADYVGAVGSGDADLQTSTVVESTRAGTVLIGSSRERIGFDDAVRVKVLRELARKAVGLFPFLGDVPVMRTYGGFRPYAPDHLPVIGRGSARRRVSGTRPATKAPGIGLAASTGRLITELFLGLAPHVTPDPFRVDRPAVLGMRPDPSVRRDAVHVDRRRAAGQRARPVRQSPPCCWPTAGIPGAPPEERAPRGVFCGIGACYDCLVVVNGIPDVRACQRTIRPATQITTQQGAVLPAPPAEQASDGARSFRRRGSLVRAPRRRVVEVVVVGGGPAGIAAALAAGDAGASVLLVDSGRAVGGQFNRQLPKNFELGGRSGCSMGGRLSPPSGTGWRPIRGSRTWRRRLFGRSSKATGCGCSRGRPMESGGRSSRSMRRRSCSRPAPTIAYFPSLVGICPGSTAPAPRRRWPRDSGSRSATESSSPGTGPFLLPVAESLVGVGAEVVGLLEANSLKTVRKGWATDPLVASEQGS